MAVYGASLQSLARVAARRAAQSVRVPEETPVRQAGAGGTGAPPAEEGNAASSQPAAGPELPNAAQTVRELLELPPARIEALLSEWGESGSKALLILIHRLATVEQELAELKARSASVPGVVMGLVSPSAASGGHAGPAGKAELLEQVFQKNVSLRRMGL